MRKSLLIAASGLALTLAAPALAQDTGGNSPGGGGSEDWAALKAQYEAQTAAYKAAAEAAKAKQAVTEAQQAAQKAEFGGVTGQTGITGTTDVGTGAGQAEVTLLATKATAAAAIKLAEKLPVDREKKLIVVSTMDELSQLDRNIYDFQRQRLLTQLQVAIEQCNTAIRAAEQGGSAGSDRSLGVVAGGALDLASKLGSYFLTDYKTGSVTVTVPDRLDIVATVAALRARNLHAGYVVPAFVAPQDATAILNELAPLDGEYRSALKLGAKAKGRIAKVPKENVDQIAALTAADAAATKAATAYEAFVTGLVTPATGTAEASLTRILRQKLVHAALTGGAKVLLIESKKGGQYYSKKNLWTFLVASPPLYTMAGVAMTYALIDPASGTITAEGAIPVHGGYKSVGKVEKLFQ